MKRRTVSIVSAVVLGIFAVTMVLAYTPAFAATAQQQLEDAKRKKAEQEEKVRQLEKEAADNKQANAADKEAALAKKREYDEKMQRLSSQQNEIQQQLDAITQNLDTLNQEYQTALDNAANREEGMKKRLRAMQENSVSNYLEILFSAKSFSDFFVRLDMIRDIISYDSQVLKQLRAASEEIKEKKTAVEAEKTNKEAEEMRLRANKQETQNILDAQNALVGQFESAEQQDQAAINKAKQDAAALDAEIRRLEDQVLAQIAQQQKSSGVVYTGSGQLLWPTPTVSAYTDSFGWRMHPIWNERRFHSGLDISAPYGSRVVAADSGTVTFAGYNSSYGNYVTIDHGNGMSTLYAHNSSLLVSSGQRVERGQQIAVSGSTGWSTGPHVHFEVIVNGQRQNPLNYARP